MTGSRKQESELYKSVLRFQNGPEVTYCGTEIEYLHSRTPKKAMCGYTKLCMKSKLECRPKGAGEIRGVECLPKEPASTKRTQVT